MSWVKWSRKATDAVVDQRPLGVDYNAERARAVQSRTAKHKTVMLDDPHSDLALAINLDTRTPEVGRAAWGMLRKLPHLTCTGYLPFLNQPQEWKSPRHTLTADTALPLAFDRLRKACQGFEGVALALPSYLSVPQVNKLLSHAEKVKLKVRGTAAGPLALAAERATHYLQGTREEDPTETPRPGKAIATTSVLVVDVDDHALTASVIRITEEEVRVLATSAYPRLGTKVWRERLLDMLADRCVRLCRRDPRDNADAEQMLFDQIDGAIDRARTGQRVALNVRSTHWYQDLIHAPADLDSFCAPLCRLAVEEVRNLLGTIGTNEPPRAAWLTHDAGRLPGLAAALHQNMTERTSVRVLHSDATAIAVANLVDRWATGEIPRTHLDTVIVLPPRPDPRLAANPKAPTRR